MSANFVIPNTTILAPSIMVLELNGMNGPSNDMSAVVKLRHIVNAAKALVVFWPGNSSASKADVMVIQTASAIPRKIPIPKMSA
mmetsp:Transcript_26466/g.63892  ORF Transcript_26466/g.63892 Transcript_26466/m.63892 type:complete len:84 (-) Transcript_26466:1089-1340(-)